MKYILSRKGYYDSKIARFLSEDTYKGQANDPLSLNLYTYCLNNPIRYIDPTGHAVTQWDKDNGLEAALTKITEDYEAARKAGSKTGMEDAHKAAEAERNKVRETLSQQGQHYVGSSDGYTYSVTQTSSGTNYDLYSKDAKELNNRAITSKASDLPSGYDPRNSKTDVVYEEQYKPKEEPKKPEPVQNKPTDRQQDEVEEKEDSLVLTEEMKEAGVTITIQNGKKYYDYSQPINQMIKKNAQLCFQHRAIFTDEWYLSDLGDFILNMKRLYDSMDWFVEVDGSGAPWDIKIKDRWEEQFPGIPYLGLRKEFVLNGTLQHAEGVGNIAFGYWARALGYGPETIYYGAGWAQIGGTKTPKSLFDRRLAEGPLYGDMEDDHEWLNFGINWYDSDHPKDNYVVNINPAKIYWMSNDIIKFLLERVKW